MPPPSSRLTDTVGQWVHRCRTPRVVRLLLVIVSIVFAGGIYLSINAVDLRWREFCWPLLVALVLFAGPATLTLNTVETELSAVIAGHRFGWARALRIAVLSTAANVLPLPGGPIVRAAALNIEGTGLKTSGGIIFAIALLWLGLSFLYAGLWLIVPHPVPGWGFSVFGAVAGCTAVMMIRRITPDPRVALWALLLKSATVAVGLTRLTLALMTVQVTVTMAQVSVFAISGVAGASVSIIPAGLGVNESVAALLAPLAAIAPATAFLGVGISRIAGWTFFLPCALVLARRSSLSLDG